MLREFVPGHEVFGPYKYRDAHTLPVRRLGWTALKEKLNLRRPKLTQTLSHWLQIFLLFLLIYLSHSLSLVFFFHKSVVTLSATSPPLLFLPFVPLLPPLSEILHCTIRYLNSDAEQTAAVTDADVYLHA